MAIARDEIYEPGTAPYNHVEEEKTKYPLDKGEDWENRYQSLIFAAGQYWNGFSDR